MATTKLLHAVVASKAFVLDDLHIRSGENLVAVAAPEVFVFEFVQLRVEVCGEFADEGFRFQNVVEGRKHPSAAAKAVVEESFYFVHISSFGFHGFGGDKLRDDWGQGGAQQKKMNVGRGPQICLLRAIP